MDEWETRPLKAFVDPDRSICYGIVQPGARVDSGVPILRVNNFTGSGLNVSNAVRVAESIERDYKRSRLQGGELLITLVGSLGLTAIATDELKGWNVARAVGVIPLANDADVRWINFVVRSQPAQDFMARRANTTVQPTFNLKDLAELPIPMPPDRQRWRISELLSALDDKIELNRRMNDTLETSARALFRDWFVDFGPTRAKAESSPAYLAPKAWSLFPDRLGGGGVPEGWGTARLADHASVTKGRSYSSIELSPSPTALVTLKSFERGGGYRRDGLKPYTGTFKDEQIINDGEIVIPQTDVTQAAELIGRPARVIGDMRFERLVASLDVAILRPKPQSYLDRAFLFGLADSNAFTHHMLAHTTGTTVLHLAKNAIQSFEFVLPSAELVAAHCEQIVPLIRKISRNVQESDALAATRDALLPKLMSGKLRVRDAEALAA